MILNKKNCDIKKANKLLNNMFCHESPISVSMLEDVNINVKSIPDDIYYLDYLMSFV